MTENDEILPDTGMMSGSDSGDPGDRLDAVSLSPSEQALLDSLVSGSAPAVEASDETLRAASDDTTMAAPLPPGDDDPFTPTFQEP